MVHLHSGSIFQPAMLVYQGVVGWATHLAKLRFASQLTAIFPKRWTSNGIGQPSSIRVAYIKYWWWKKAPTDSRIVYHSISHYLHGFILVKSKSRLFLDSLIIFFYDLFMISLWLPFMFFLWYDLSMMFFFMIYLWIIYDFFMISRKFHEIPKENSKK